VVLGQRRVHPAAFGGRAAAETISGAFAGALVNVADPIVSDQRVPVSKEFGTQTLHPGGVRAGHD
jgi:hypothetical protein